LLTCSIIGDSIAVGIAQFRPECLSLAKVGTSLNETYYQLFRLVKNIDQIIISVGSNDYYLTENDVLKFRILINARQVIWLLPMKKSNKNAIKQVARQFNDTIIDIAPVISIDKIHPTLKGYKYLAEKTK
jgi:hypothetical protein